MGKTIIIVDDMLFMRMTLKKIAETAGFEVVGEAENGELGLALYKEKKPYVVFMDITMPIMDGIEALKAIRAWDTQAKVVIISAMGQEDRVKNAIQHGAINFVVKPFQEDRIIKLLGML